MCDSKKKTTFKMRSIFERLRNVSGQKKSELFYPKNFYRQTPAGDRKMYDQREKHFSMAVLSKPFAHSIYYSRIFTNKRIKLILNRRVLISGQSLANVHASGNKCTV